MIVIEELIIAAAMKLLGLKTYETPSTSDYLPQSYCTVTLPNEERKAALQKITSTIMKSHRDQSCQWAFS